ncbi:hypothetical protein KAK06_01475 [Ideonella sp. 4Y11]|uniref:Glycoamylase-like domain-containing protein n=1 Tax=Ideonella aquatica TaxID=2824119 RepID=A0A940YJX5_9BURK|nr:glucoamylase family protein [Ideonella aquatica]MBQ0957616.1 hypothetical protein [Ideonella aquatica]
MPASPSLTRRHLLALAPAGLLPLSVQAASPFGETDLPASNDVLLDDLLARTIGYFWDTTHPVSGLAPDRSPGNPRMASTAATGFALAVFVAAVQSGLRPREQALARCLTAARFLAQAPQGPQASGVAGHRGFFYHFIDIERGTRFAPGVELSSIDTAWLLTGLLTAQAFFDGDHADERELRQRVQAIHERIDWPWMQQRGGLICMGWNPERGFADFIDYLGYDEATMMYLLALGSPTHPAAASSWDDYCRTYTRGWGTFMGQTHLGGAPLFWHQFSHCFIDFRGLQDRFMRDKGLDYFENSRRATLAQRAYAVANPQDWNDYGADIWGLTACDGPGMIQGPDHRGRTRQFHDYRARGAALVGTFDDGTLAPAAGLSSLPFAPEVVLPLLRALRQRFGRVIYNHHGFVDSFNTSFRAEGAQLSDGRTVPGFGWTGTDHIGIDQGSIALAAANHRHGGLWRVMRGEPTLRRGLRRAGFTGGWLG